MDNEETFLSVREAASILHLSRSSILNRCKKGEISSIRIGHKFLINKTAFYAWLDKQTVRGEEKAEEKKEVPAPKPIVQGRSGFDRDDSDSSYYNQY